LDEKIEGFVSAYRKTSHQVFYDEKNKRLRHTGEYGTYREILVREFLNFFTPSRLDIHNGFLITSTDSVSTQCDAIVFDAKNTPLIENGERQRFFPVETACAIGEVKSTLSKAQLKSALNKLARNKALREQIPSPTIIRRERQGSFNPQIYAYDQLPTFLICQSFDFDFSSLVNEVNSFYDPDIEVRNRHNLVLSLRDGLLAYVDSNNKTLMFSETMGRIQPDGSLSPKKQLRNRLVVPDASTSSHIKIFCSYIFLLSSSVTILYPDVSNYMTTGNIKLIDEPIA
jgi:Domain of unknown function (DUF6602)